MNGLGRKPVRDPWLSGEGAHPVARDGRDDARGHGHAAQPLAVALRHKQVAAALCRELLRDGQVFYVHNRVRTIDEAANRVSALVPEARVAVAHGQMPEEQLESTVQGFWNREFDILVMLIADPGAVVSRDDLLRRLWGTTWAVQTKAIDVHVSSLRRKLGDPAWVEAVRGVGFRLGAPAA